MAYNKRLTGFVEYCGCGAKFSAGELDELLKEFLQDEIDTPNLLIGPNRSDDAAAYRLDDGSILLQTVDFFPPVVDDPYMFGQIAAANALSDIYAMGGKPIMAMNLVCFPKDMDKKILGAIMRGAKDKVREAGAIIVGGHTIMDPIPKFGLSVTGQVDEANLLANHTVQEGDCIILTKPIGTGIVLKAAKEGALSLDEQRLAITTMATLNGVAAGVVNRHGSVHACSDVTGFGLGGHLTEMLKPSGLTARIDMSKVPILPLVKELAEQGFLSAAVGRNYDHFHKDCCLKIDKNMQNIFFDPQTSGGLLISVDKADAKYLLDELHQVLDTQAEIIGAVERNQGYSLLVEG